MASLVFGLLSLSMALSWLFVLVPIAGIFAGWMSLRRIRRLREDMTGMELAHAGIALSLLFGLGGGTYQYFVVHGVPAGYTSIAFVDLQPDPTKPEEWIPPKAFELEPTDKRDHKVYIKGFIHPSVRTLEFKEFVLVPSVSHCSMCSWQIRSTELIRVRLTGDLKTKYRPNEIAVGGRLRIDRSAAQNPYGASPYVLEADYVQ